MLCYFFLSQYTISFSVLVQTFIAVLPIEQNVIEDFVTARPCGISLVADQSLRYLTYII